MSVAAVIHHVEGLKKQYCTSVTMYPFNNTSTVVLSSFKQLPLNFTKSTLKIFSILFLDRVGVELYLFFLWERFFDVYSFDLVTSFA